MESQRSDTTDDLAYAYIHTRNNSKYLSFISKEVTLGGSWDRISLQKFVGSGKVLEKHVKCGKFGKIQSVTINENQKTLQLFVIRG